MEAGIFGVVVWGRDDSDAPVGEGGSGGAGLGGITDNEGKVVFVNVAELGRVIVFDGRVGAGFDGVVDVA